jgi:hypothetical protein
VKHAVVTASLLAEVELVLGEVVRAHELAREEAGPLEAHEVGRLAGRGSVSLSSHLLPCRVSPRYPMFSISNQLWKRPPGVPSPEGSFAPVSTKAFQKSIPKMSFCLLVQIGRACPS